MKIFEWIKLLRRHLRQIQGNWGGRNFKLPHVWLHSSLRMQECRDESDIYIYQRFQLLNNKEGCVRLGNLDLDFEIGFSDFAIEREIRKQISLPRNPSSWWVSIKKSKSGFHGFPFYRSIGKSEKGFAKLFSWTAAFLLIIMRARTRPLFLRTVFQILFGFPNRTVKTDISALKSVFGFRVRL